MRSWDGVVSLCGAGLFSAQPWWLKGDKLVCLGSPWRWLAVRAWWAAQVVGSDPPWPPLRCLSQQGPAGRLGSSAAGERVTRVLWREAEPPSPSRSHRFCTMPWSEAVAGRAAALSPGFSLSFSGSWDIMWSCRALASEGHSGVGVMW